jgi:plastocyanin
MMAPEPHSLVDELDRSESPAFAEHGRDGLVGEIVRLGEHRPAPYGCVTEGNAGLLSCVVAVMRVRMLVLSVLALVATARPAAAGGGGAYGTCAGFTRGATIAIQDSCFQGTAHIVEPGTTVTVTNYGQLPHDFTAVDGSFSSGLLQPSQSFQVTLHEPGAIAFYCTLHGSASGSGMAGVLFVEQPASSGVRQAAMNTPRAATDTVHVSVPAFLAAGALLAAVGLGVAIGRVHPRRRAPGAARQV